MTEKNLKFRVGAVSYLNTVPLVWGMLHGEQTKQVDISFSVPSECARQVETGAIDIGLVPVAEIARQGLDVVPGVGIACFGAVRSISLFSRVPWPEVRTLAADLSSRTSVQLARVILRECFGASAQIIERQPALDAMLSESDAALIIGDPALRLDPAALPYEHLDLGAEWTRLTGLPMVFAAWAGRSPDAALQKITLDSYEFGRVRLDEIIDREYRSRGVTRELASDYLHRYIRFTLGEFEMKGLRTFIDLADLQEEKNAYATTSH